MVAAPKGCNSATMAGFYATSSATGNATPSLKTLANIVLTRNHECNDNATAYKNSCNFRGNFTAEKLHSLEQLAGDDWQSVKNNPEQLGALVSAYETNQQLQAGITPSWYTKTVQCKACGDVKLWEGCPDEVLGCPWCLVKNKRIEL